MGEIVICKEVELVKEIADVDTAQWIHPRKGQDAGESRSSIS
jgi:hypothetical protein